MRPSVNYKANLLRSSLKSRGFLKTLQRLLRKIIYPIKGLPTHITIEITNRCNLNCPYCAASRDLMRGQECDMGFGNFKKIIDDISGRNNYLPTIQIAFRGEPFLNKDACDIVEYAASRRFYVVAASNGLLLNKEVNRKIILARLNYLIISLDGARKDTYDSLRRGGNFGLLLENIKDIVRQKKELNSQKPFLELQCIITRKNEEEINDFIRLAAELGVDYAKFKSYKLTCSGRDNNSIESLKQYLPEENKYSRYRIKDENLVVKERANSCSWRNDCLIYADGDVGPCCEDFNKEYAAGNVLRDNFWMVWKSEAFVKLRKRIKNRGLTICNTCS